MATRNPGEDIKKRKYQAPLNITKVSVKTLNRQTQDIGTWRTALRNADNGRRQLLYNLYEDILLDNVLSDAIDKRVEAITSADLIFSVNDQEVDEINHLMEREEWEQMLHEIMLAKFWGITVLEFDFSKLFTAHSWPRTHIRPEKGIVMLNENDETGLPYLDDPFFLEVKPRKTKGREGFGLILKACPYAIYKRGNFGDWAQFAEIFGMPFRTGKYNSHDEAARVQLEQAMEQAGSAAYAVIPKDSDIEFLSNNSTGDGQLYDKLRKACNEEILYGILGQTMTTVQGDKGARSLGDVHMEVQQSKHLSDRRFVARILNNEILPRLEARGFPVKGGKFAFPEIGETLSLKERITIDSQLTKIVKIDPDYFYETYGIEKPKDGGGLVDDKPDPAPEPPQPEKGKKTKKDKTTLTDLPDSFWSKLVDLFSFAPRDQRGWQSPHEL